MHDAAAAMDLPRVSFLAEDEPAPFELVNPAGGARLLLVCDHASSFVPRRLGRLGLDEAQLARHIAWDIGAGELARALARRLDAPALLSGFSRLVIDPNRRLDDPTSIVQISDGTVVPGNRDLAPAARAARVEDLFRPYHAAVDREIARLAARAPVPAVISVHSFTPVMKGEARPWQVGVLWDRDPRLPLPLLERLRADGLEVGENQPYSARGGNGYTLEAQAAPRGLPHVLIEVRQDLIDTRHGVADWARRLGDALGEVLRPMGVLAAAGAGDGG